MTFFSSRNDPKTHVKQKGEGERADGLSGLWWRAIRFRAVSWVSWCPYPLKMASKLGVVAVMPVSNLLFHCSRFALPHSNVPHQRAPPPRWTGKRGKPNREKCQSGHPLPITENGNIGASLCACRWVYRNHRPASGLIMSDAAAAQFARRCPCQQCARVLGHERHQQ